MRLSFIAVLLSGAIASVSAQDFQNISPCTQDCWNQAAAQAGCDPNKDDACLCGPFFDAVAGCVSAVCSVPDNLAALDFLDSACQ
ncbi:uncharacterized protein BDR25DRAFT_300698 [Lindgomyces ingoldianus]|uniref:Uncharacterized protein n=1 Tax=Lindgomyces ingoldianus TaxID=673940 RepID=A0ACB6RA94_9PLEO|nr:uncharacterized protein BDR25DRAFT_300698 [Lindgomyces ingoldianus]KAF2475688.1 hypothetical protein BDR25DRAFT_300698 [Lindgomyces ingoldianus]